MQEQKFNAECGNTNNKRIDEKKKFRVQQNLQHTQNS